MKSQMTAAQNEGLTVREHGPPGAGRAQDRGGTNVRDYAEAEASRGGARAPWMAVSTCGG